MTSYSPDYLRTAHSFLFVPANRPDRIAKALGSGADVVIIDLEDAVAAEDKDAAREALARAWKDIKTDQRQRVLVRINASASRWYSADAALMATLAAESLGGVMLPKSETVAQLDALAQALPAGGIVPLIESAEGLHAIGEIARAARVVRLAFGHLDFQADIGMSSSPDEQELLPVRLAIVLASRRANLAAPIDGVTTAIDNAERLAADTAGGRRLGFRAKLCIHPKQVETVNKGFCATADETDWARRVLEASRQQGLGAFTLDGRMIDAPVIQMARNLLGLTAAPGSTIV